MSAIHRREDCVSVICSLRIVRMANEGDDEKGGRKSKEREEGRREEGWKVRQGAVMCPKPGADCFQQWKRGRGTDVDLAGTGTGGWKRRRGNSDWGKRRGIFHESEKWLGWTSEIGKCRRAEVDNACISGTIRELFCHVSWSTIRYPRDTVDAVRLDYSSPGNVSARRSKLPRNYFYCPMKQAEMPKHASLWLYIFRMVKRWKCWRSSGAKVNSSKVKGRQLLAKRLFSVIQ